MILNSAEQLQKKWVFLARTCLFLQRMHIPAEHMYFPAENVVFKGHIARKSRKLHEGFRAPESRTPVLSQEFLKHLLNGSLPHIVSANASDKRAFEVVGQNLEPC